MLFNEIIESIPVKPYFRDPSADIVIYCADNRDILKYIPDKSIDLVLTDPPYNGGLDYGERTNDKRSWVDYVKWLVPIVKESERVAFGPVIYFLSHFGLIEMIREYKPYWVGAWYTTCNYANPVNTGGMIILPYWEPYLIYGNLKNIHAVLPDCIQCLPNREKLKHPCPKPLKVMQSIIGCGDFSTCLEPFMGSGTTLLASKKLGRKCIGIEIEEKYCRIATQRLSQSVMVV